MYQRLGRAWDNDYIEFVPKECLRNTHTGQRLRLLQTIRDLFKERVNGETGRV